MRSGVPAHTSLSTPARVTLLTDFGTCDGYVAAMKGVIATRAPGALIDDASHDIPPGDIHAAAWALAGYWRHWPEGTVHVVVVDPGVGSARRGLAAEVEGRFLIGPDNGVFSRVLADAARSSIVSIENAAVMRDVVSTTFHGRDIFAPAAAHLAGGGSLHDLGPLIDDPVVFELPRPARQGGSVIGEVVHVDRFGNAITNIPAAIMAGEAAVLIAGQRTALRRTYADVESGEICAVIGSSGLLEVSVRDASAAERLGLGRGSVVTVEERDRSVTEGTEG